MPRLWVHAVWFVVGVPLVTGCHPDNPLILLSLRDMRFEISSIRKTDYPGSVPLSCFFDYPGALRAKIRFLQSTVEVKFLDQDLREMGTRTGSYEFRPSGGGHGQVEFRGEGLGLLAGTWDVNYVGWAMVLTQGKWVVETHQAL